MTHTILIYRNAVMHSTKKGRRLFFGVKRPRDRGNGFSASIKSKQIQFNSTVEFHSIRMSRVTGLKYSNIFVHVTGLRGRAGITGRRSARILIAAPSSQFGVGFVAGKKWTKTSSAILFGGVVKKPVRKFTTVHIDEEAVLMEALAEAAEDARLNDGAIEESGDEYAP
ncbi:hypothetical protein C8J57DRAFT_1213343 [Mycena rebaudengoi]|nr:hypothetical protein C8J57DRAFT_1213343 [Mycena rebaudengoi]